MRNYKQLVGKPCRSFACRARSIGIGFGIVVFWTALMAILIKSRQPQIPFFPGGYLPARVEGFIFSCLIAPLWEELAFRHGPLNFAKAIGKQAVMPMVLITSVWFGWMHNNGNESIILQGVMGFVTAMVYIKNGFSYWSAVILHFLWNVFIMFVLPIYR